MSIGGLMVSKSKFQISGPRLLLGRGKYEFSFRLSCSEPPLKANREEAE